MSDHEKGELSPRETAMSRIVIPERQRVEEALVEAKLEIERKFAAQSIDLRQLRSAIDSCSDGILIVGADGKVRDFNQSLTRLLQVGETAIQDADQSVAFEAFGRLFEDAEQVKGRFDAISVSTQLESHDLLKDRFGRVLAFSSYIQIIDGAVVGRVWNVRQVPDEGRGGPRNIA